MQKLTISALLAILIATPALAGWVDDFSANFKSEGIEVAVPKALEEGQSPDSIVTRGLQFTSLNPQNLLKALYCSGANGDDIKQAADNNGISEIMVVAAFKKSVAECGDAVADSQAYTPIDAATDTQAYTPAATGPNFAGMPSPGNPSGSSYASPSTF